MAHVLQWAVFTERFKRFSITTVGLIIAAQRERYLNAYSRERQNTYEHSRPKRVQNLEI